MSLTNARRAADHNLHMMSRLYHYSMAHILKQGSGCIIDGYGPAYHNKANKTDDVFGIYFVDKKLLRWQEGVTISDDRSKILVRKLIQRFMINQTGCERERFIQFLQAVQNAHDFAFDPFIRVEHRMQRFKDLMQSVNENFLQKRKPL